MVTNFSFKSFLFNIIILLIKIFCIKDPRLTDYDTLLENLNGLKMGKTVNVPIYDFKTSSRSGSR